MRDYNEFFEAFKKSYEFFNGSVVGPDKLGDFGYLIHFDKYGFYLNLDYFRDEIVNVYEECLLAGSELDALNTFIQTLKNMDYNLFSIEENEYIEKIEKAVFEIAHIISSLNREREIIKNLEFLGRTLEEPDYNSVVCDYSWFYLDYIEEYLRLLIVSLDGKFEEEIEAEE